MPALKTALGYHRHLLKSLALTMCLLGFSLDSFAQPQVAQLTDVKNCQYLKQIEGGSGYGKNFSWQKLAKYAVLSQAEKIAATHVIWVRFDPVGGFNGIAVANAYRCQS